MSKKRPGVEAGINLVALDDVRTWEKVEEHCKEVIDSIANLPKYEQNLQQLGSVKDDFSKDDLDKVVLWKHTVGKNRIYNVKYLNANSDASVQKHSRSAIALARGIKVEDCLDDKGALTQQGRKNVQEAVGELGKLKGVGPATASAVLTLVRPDLFCYLYDEVIDCFEPQRDYKISNYLRVNSRCLQIAKSLGSGWTTSRVAKTIWTAARFLALKGEDLTEDDSSRQTDEESDDEDEDEDDEMEDEDEDEEEDGEEEDEKPDAVEPPRKRKRR